MDDGVATGSTVRAAIRWLRSRPGLARLVLAVPVIAATTARELRSEVDDLVALEVPEDLIAIGAWYEDFSQTSDAVVLDLLARAAARTTVEREARVPLGDGRVLAASLAVPPARAAWWCSRTAAAAAGRARATAPSPAPCARRASGRC